jgi:hypothetical protein
MAENDTIPRIAQFPAHMTAQLLGLADGSSFEHARLRAIATARSLFDEGIGRDLASRVGHQDKMWSTTADLLAEGMHLGFVESDKLPSSRRYLEQYRDRTYKLTELGREMAQLASDPALTGALYDRLLETLIDRHPHFRALLRALSENPLIFPEVTEEDIKLSKSEKRGLSFWATRVVSVVGAEPNRLADVERIIRDFINNRFEGAVRDTVSNKDTAKALNEAMAAGLLYCRNLPFGPTDLRILAGWGMAFLLLDQSRYVTRYPNANVIWLASDIQSEPSIKVERRGLGRFARSIATSVVDTYRELSLVDRYSALEAPYIPIHCVRAPVAFELRVTRALVDRVLEQIVAGQFPELNVLMQLHLGNSVSPPNSEPIYKRGGARKYVMTVRAVSNG